MPMKLPSRGTVLLVVFIVAALALLGYLSSLNEKGSGAPSSYDARKKGGKAAYLFLLQSGYPVERWDKSPADLPQDPSGTTLIFAGSETSPDQHAPAVVSRGEPNATRDERMAITRFVSAGGRVVVTGDWMDYLTLSGAPKFSQETRVGHAVCKPVAPTSLTRGGAITQDGYYYWDEDRTEHVVHYVDSNDHAVVVSYKFGKGEVIWWASPLPLTNVGIRDKGNLEFLLASVAGSRRILWDEYYHSSHESTDRANHYALILRWGWLQLAVLALALVLSYSRRSGPIIALPRVSRLSPLEFVHTMGNVFHKAGATQVAVEIAFGRLRQVASRRLGMKPDADAGEIARIMLQRSYGMTEELAARLKLAQAAIDDPDLRESAAIGHVRAINQVLAKLEKERSAHV